MADLEEVLSRVPQCITPDLAEVLEAEFTGEEIRIALFQMVVLKHRVRMDSMQLSFNTIGNLLELR